MAAVALPFHRLCLPIAQISCLSMPLALIPLNVNNLNPQTAAHINFAVSFTSDPSSLLHIVSITTFTYSKISCSVFLLSIPVSFVVSTFEGLVDFWRFFPHLSAVFLSRCRNVHYKYVTSFTKFEWSVIFSSYFKNGTSENKKSQAWDEANIRELHV